MEITIKVQNIYALFSKHVMSRKHNAYRLLNKDNSLVFKDYNHLINIANIYTNLPYDKLVKMSPILVSELLVACYLNENYSYEGFQDDQGIAIDIVNVQFVASELLLLA